MHMLTNKKTNSIFGWSVFGLSLLVYLITFSRTVNFWDCGELIACSTSMQIGHPPGAPFYMVLARFFSIFAINAKYTALFVNLLSVLASSFTVFFTYHSIVILIKRIIKKDISDFNTNDKFIVFGSAAIGALSLAFSTTFWASAIETEIYSVSILFTSACFWTMLRRGEATSKSDKNRWLILTALLLGFSTGIHLLNILVIPALVFVYYYDLNLKGNKNFFKTLAIAIGLLAFVQITISYLPLLAAQFEWFFVNDLHTGFNSGLYAFAIFIVGIIVFGIWISGKKKKIILNLILTAFAVFLSGYSTYTIVLIRSAANPNIDQNNPETIYNFISYLNREQYGNRPLWYGQQYNSQLDENNPYTEGEAIYDTIENKYAIIAHKPEANYVDADKTVLPRMWSNQPRHVAAYQEWTGYKQDKKPPFVENLEFMFRYQFSHMYFRYFMWNFVGKQNDILSHGGPINGNWVSGIGLKNTKNRPSFLDNNKARNPYYFLPLILGIIGFVFQLKKDRKFGFVLSLVFIFTGIAIAFYLNQHPYQARERDYSFIGSFYAFAIWIGIGVYGLSHFISTRFKHKYLTYGVLAICFLAVPFQFLARNFNDHNNRKNDFAYYFAYNLLNSCEENAILFTSGDNETFPLWYLQETQNIRTDVKVVNLNFLNTDWYVDQIVTKRNESEPIKISIFKSQYISGTRELLLVRNNPYAFIEDIYYENISEINADYQAVLYAFINILLDNGFDQSNPEQYNNFVSFYSKIQAHGANPAFRDFVTIINSLESQEQCDIFGITQTQALDIQKKLRILLDKQVSYPIPLNQTLNFVFSEDTATKIDTKLYPYPIDYFPSPKLSYPINKSNIAESFNLSEIQELFLVDKMIWETGRESLTKSDLMVLEIIRTNMWQRPVYFSSTMNTHNYLGLDKYLYLEGLAYRLIPMETDVSENETVNVNASVMYENFTKNFQWGNLRGYDSYYDENTRITLVNLRNHYSRLARGLYFEGEIKKSEEMLDQCVEYIPNKLVPYSYYTVGIIHGYYRINKKLKAREVAQVLAENAIEELEFYSGFPHRQQYSLDLYKQRSMKIIEELYILADQYNHKEFLPKISNIYSRAAKLYEADMNTNN